MAQTREDSTTEDDAGVLKENGCGLRNEYVPFSLWFLCRRSLTDISSFFLLILKLKSIIWTHKRANPKSIKSKGVDED